MGADGYAKSFIPTDSDDVLLASKLLNPDQMETMEITFDAPGKYQFVCTFPGHAQMMRGIIEVK